MNNQEKEGGYKREFTKKDLVEGKGYEGSYFNYPSGVFEELGKEAGLPESMINKFLKEDFVKVFEDIAKTMSKKDTIYTLIPHKKIYEFSNGEMRETDTK